MSEAERGYLPDGQYNTPSDFTKWRSPYDFSSEELDDLQRRNHSPSWTFSQTTATAQTPQNPLIINQPGRAFRIQGITLATQYNFAANTGIETVASTVFIGAYVAGKNGSFGSQFGDPNSALLIKHGGGFRGDFLSLALFWPAQASNAFRITIYRYDGVPWQNGDTGT